MAGPMSDDIARQALARSLAARAPSLGHDALLIVDQLVIRLQILQQEHGELDVTTLPGFILYFGTEPVDSALYEIAVKLSNQRIDRAAMQDAARAEMLRDDVPIRAGAPEAIGFTPRQLREQTAAAVAAEDALRDPEVTARNAAWFARHHGPVLTCSTPLSIHDADPSLRVKALDQMEQECRRLTIESERDFAPDQLTRVGGPAPYDGEEIDEDPGPHTHVYVGDDQGLCDICGVLRDQFADASDVGGRA